MALYVNGKNSSICFGSFGDGHMPKGNKNIITDVYRILAYNYIICGCNVEWIYWF